MSGQETRTRPGPVVAIGGGSLTVSSRVPRGFAAVLQGLLPTSSTVRILYLGTPSKDDLAKERDASALFDRLARERHVNFIAAHLDDLGSSNLVNWCLNAHIIYVSSGNTAFAIDIWRRNGVDKVLRQAWMRGTACAGSSAGALCWFERFVTDSFGEARVIPGLGLVNGIAAAHYDKYVQGRSLLLASVTSDRGQRGIGIADGSAVVIYPDKSCAALNLRRGRSMRVIVTDSGVLEQPIGEIEWRCSIMERDQVGL